MDMTPQTAWLIAISAVVLVGVVAFFIGRSTAGTKARIDELEAELRSKKAEVEGYRKEVEQHLDKTATLFVSMAGAYKEMFEHVSSGYEKLSSGSARELFQQRVDALLIGAGRGTGEASEAGKLLGGTAAAAAAGAVVAGAATESAPESAVAESAAQDGMAEPVLAQGGAPAVRGDAEMGVATGTREPEPLATDDYDDRVRRAEGIAFDPTIDEVPRSELR